MKKLILFFLLFFSNNFYPSPENEEDGSLLFNALYDKDYTLIKELITKKKGINSYNGFGVTPLMFAAEMGHCELVSMLLENGADPNIKDYCGKTVRDRLWECQAEFSISLKKMLTIFKLLKQYNGHLIYEKYEWTSLMYAVDKNDAYLVKKLLKKEQYPNRITSIGGTALLCAFNNNNEEVFDMILMPNLKFVV